MESVKYDYVWKKSKINAFKPIRYAKKKNTLLNLIFDSCEGKNNHVILR